MAVVAYKYRFYPNAEQKSIFAQTFGCSRFVYNYFLNYNIDQYKIGNKTNYRDWSSQLSQLKKDVDLPWLKIPSSVPLQQSLKHLEKGFTNFFKGRAKYPKFKAKKNSASAHYTKSSFEFDEIKKELTIGKMKQPLKIKFSRHFVGCPSSVVVSKNASGEYYVSMLVETDIKPLEIVNKSVGVDLGVTSLAVCSDGQVFDSPKATRRYALQLASQQRILARKLKASKVEARKLKKLNAEKPKVEGEELENPKSKFKKSKRYEKQRIKVAKIHQKIKNTRIDAMHKLTRKLINENQVICIEDLSVNEMVKKRKSKRRLSKHIYDASFFEFKRQLEYKGLWAGRIISVVDKYFPSSKQCSSCGDMFKGEWTLSIRKWDCHCGVSHDRDFNASINIHKEGLRILA